MHKGKYLSEGGPPKGKSLLKGMGDFRIQPRRRHPKGACQRDRGPQGCAVSEGRVERAGGDCHPQPGRGCCLGAGRPRGQQNDCQRLDG